MTTTASPPIESTNIKFQDLFDLEEIQSIQDTFAKATGVASIITDTDGSPITKPSNFCRLCRDIIRKTEKGLSNCMHSDAVLGRGNPNGPTMQTCLSGALWDGGASIMVGDKHIANWLVGQVRNEQQDEERMLAYAREIGADEEAFLAALAEVTIMTTEQFSHVCQALFVMAKQMSKLAYQNVLQARIIRERDKVEEALRENEERFRQVAMTNWVWEVDLEGRYTYCSENVKDTMGYSREEIIGKKPFDFMSQEEASRVGEIFTEIFATQGRIIDLVNWNIAKNGSEICLLTNGAPFYDKTGNIIGYRGGDKDITDSKRAEEELRASEERYRRLYKETPAMLHSIDSMGRILSVSNYWLNTLGYEKDEVINRKSTEFLTEESRRYAQEVVLPEFFRTGYCFEVPYQYIKKNGDVLDILLSAIAEKDGKGNVTRSLAVSVDVTERKKAEEALRKSEEKFRLLLNSTAEAIYGLDTRGICTFCNPACLKILGYESEADILGKNMHNLIHHHRRDGSEYPEKQCRVHSAFIKGEGVCVDDEVLWRSDGSSFEAEYSSYPMRSGKEVTGAVVTFQDITERKKVQEALIEAKNCAEAANQVKSEFLAKVSHEIRTPMAVFMSAIDHLLDIEKDPVHRNVLDLADLSSKRLYTLVEEILDFSKIAENKLELDEETFNLRKCLQDSVSMMKVKASEKRLSVKLEVSPDVPECIFGDEFRLGQILLNLIGNAIKFTEDGGIEISVCLKKDTLIFKIKDTGIGIPEDRLESVFDAFSQADSSTTRKYGGTGLGLAISKGIIELMGGFINVQSQLGKGSIFTFILPMKS